MMKRIDPSLSIDLQEYLDLTGFDSVESEPLEAMGAEQQSQGESVQQSSYFVGQGNQHAELLFIGEASELDGEEEAGDIGKGPAGELLGKMIQAMGFRRDEVYLATISRDLGAEAREEILKRIGQIGPRAVVALGALAAQLLLQKKLAISELRGKTWPVNVEGVEISVFPTFHPAFLLRKASHKKDVWDDLQRVIVFLKPK